MLDNLWFLNDIIVATNVSGLCDGGAKEAQNFNFAKKKVEPKNYSILQFRPTIANGEALTEGKPVL